MGNDIVINGFVEGISKESFELIKDDLEDVFNEVSWKDNAIEIFSCGKHHDDVMHSICNKISFCIDGDSSGQLDIEGEEHGDLSTIFFTPRQWKQVWWEIISPENPFLKRNPPITYSRAAYVLVNPLMWDAIENELDGWAFGNESICVESDDLKNRLASNDIENMKILHYLKTVTDGLSGEVGDIVFHM